MDQAISLKGGKAVFLIWVKTIEWEKALKDGTPYTKGEGQAEDSVISSAASGSMTGLIALWMALVLLFPCAFLTLTGQTLIAWLNYAARPIGKLGHAKPAFSSRLMILIYLMNASGRKPSLLSCHREQSDKLNMRWHFLK